MKENKNFEIKTKISDYEKFKKLSLNFSKKILHFTEEQEDIYYKIKEGRLKLRIINQTKGNLIFYRRSNKTTKRVSKYIISETNNPESLKLILQNTLPVLITVRKKREIFIHKNIRIHLDKVVGLGNYLEFEIIFNSFANARKQMEDLISYFDLNEDNFIKVSYSDLLIKKKKQNAN